MAAGGLEEPTMTIRFEDHSHRDLDSSLESQFAALLDRHKEAVTKTEWSYQEFLPLESFRADAREPRPLSATAYLAVETALLTEVNLPWYTASLSQGLADCPGPIQEFVRLWTSEEDQHATLLETYLLLTGSGDPPSRARLRKGMIAAGWRHALGGPFEGMVYTAMQEAATRTFYLCAARACGDEHPFLGAALRRIAKDETLHMAFYRDIVKVHLETDPDYLRPLAAVMLGFEMPWSASVLRDFEERRAHLAACGVFRLSDYLDEVVQPLWSYWALDRCASQSDETMKAHGQLRRYRAALRKFARSEVGRRAGTGAVQDSPSLPEG
jgi:acyl-[acyl-carrier-protein] desaturase